MNSYTPLSLVIVFAQVRSFDYLQILGFRRRNARALILQIGFQRARTQCGEGPHGPVHLFYWSVTFCAREKFDLLDSNFFATAPRCFFLFS
jgi:hypothetical protein